jgi:hypothetical protein
MALIGFNGGLIGKRRKQDPTTSGLWLPNERAVIVGSDSYWDNVSLLLHMDGSNGSTTFTDSSNNALTVTANGGAQISTAQSKFGGASGLFDGSGDFCTIAHNIALNLSQGDFTIELWVYHSSRPGSGINQVVLSKDAVAGASYSSYGININSAGLCTIELGNGAGVNPTVTAYSIGTVPLTTWTHVCVVKRNTTITTYLNGAQGSTATQGITITDGGKPLYLGFLNGGASSNAFNGYLDDLRITKGFARYQSAFTPPTAPFPNG